MAEGELADMDRAAVATDAARGLGVLAGGIVASTAAETTRAGLSKLAAAKVIGAGKLSIGAGGAKAAVAAAAATPAAAVLLPMAGAIAAGWLVRRALSRPS
ncbi:MAG: hypothetical protein AAGG47_03630 [Pseudomonadota bacterium]